MLCGLKRFFDAQRIDSAGRHAVRLQKCLIILYVFAMIKFGLTVLVDPISATICLTVSLSLFMLGWAGSRRRHRGLLMAYQLLASLVFSLIVTLVVLGVVFGVVGVGMSSMAPPMEQVSDPSQMQTLHSHVVMLKDYVPQSVAVVGHSLLSVGRDQVTTPAAPEGLPGTDEVVAASDEAAHQVTLGEVLGFMLFVFLVVVALAAGACFVMTALVVFTVIPMGALLSSVFFAAATRRALTIQKRANAVAAASASADAVEAGHVEIPMTPMVQHPGAAAAAGVPAAGAPVPGNVVYVPHTSMFPMSPSGYVSNPYSGVVYVASGDEPSK